MRASDDRTAQRRSGARVPDVRRIAVLRGGGLGDLLFAFPALDALAAAYPDAEITLLGTPMHRELLAGRPGPVDVVEVLPVAEGLRLPEGALPDPEELARFVARMRARRFDLALQLHGGGAFSNPFLRSLGARVTAGPNTVDAPPLDRAMDYVYYQQEFLRGIEVAGLVGAAPVALEPALAVTDADRETATALLGDDSRPLLAMHPGATDPRRRWPPDRFAEIAALAAEDGWRTVIVGDAGDIPLARAILAAAPDAGALDLTGRCSLGALVGVLDRADVLVSDDSGPRHLAQAVGTATVAIYWAGNVITAAPLTRARHRIHISWLTRCPVCGRDVTQVGWSAERCSHNPSFVAEVPVAPVWQDLRRLMTAELASRG
ncbi:glycosyltransferase family 9 protein [Herbiconiux sp. L3-i23]|uniref:glycosyltransferase family 9 protein n=1 Tax=Herbiconiux sp. L3-i23 TaxID=2905871 RepID=UPI00204C2689|nr:glycosyltransferase family 9 protein [Herbiconiux sp. L3-i23]BDI23324.1 hypothetical protein L3i23_21000 [Herbiconiux sp. L3-i23]